MGSGYVTDDYGPIKVPADHLFLMGDNRDGSADSRVPVYAKGLGGPVPFDAIAGRAEFISFSTDGSVKWYNPLSWFTALRSGRAGTDFRTARYAGADRGRSVGRVKGTGKGPGNGWQQRPRKQKTRCAGQERYGQLESC